MEPEPDVTLTGLPAALIDRMLGLPALTNQDRAMARSTGRCLREAVEFRHIVLRSGTLMAALRAARGLCQTLNYVQRECDGGHVEDVPASLLADAGRERPDLVAQLRVARVRSYPSTWSMPADLPPTLFPSLEIIQVDTTHALVDPVLSSGDPRVVLSKVCLSGRDDTACSRLLCFKRPPVDLCLGYTSVAAADIARARDRGLRVDTVHALRSPKQCYEQAAACVAPLATRSLICDDGGTGCLSMIKHVNAATVRDLTMTATDGFFCELEKRFPPAMGIHGLELCLWKDASNGQTLDKDVAALERMVTRGAIQSFRFFYNSEYSGLHESAWVRILDAATPALRTLNMGTLDFRVALSLFTAATLPRCTNLRFEVHDDGQQLINSYTVARFSALGRLLAAAPHLQSLHMNMHVGDASFNALVASLTSLAAGSPSIRRITCGTLVWTR